MRNYYLTLLLICICGLCFAQQQTNDISTKNPPNKEWNFNNLDGWKYGHQDNNPDNQCILENGYLRIFTRANSVDRKKVHTVERIYSTGRYTWFVCLLFFAFAQCLCNDRASSGTDHEA